VLKHLFSAETHGVTPLADAARRTISLVAASGAPLAAGNRGLAATEWEDVRPTEGDRSRFGCSGRPANICRVSEFGKRVGHGLGGLFESSRKSDEWVSKRWNVDKEVRGPFGKAAVMFGAGTLIPVLAMVGSDGVDALRDFLRRRRWGGVV
jgi:hypothetical protein